MVQGSGCRVQGVWCRVQGAGCRGRTSGVLVEGLGLTFGPPGRGPAWFRVSGFEVSRSRFRSFGCSGVGVSRLSGFRASGLRVQGFGIRGQTSTQVRLYLRGQREDKTNFCKQRFSLRNLKIEN